MNGFFGWLFFIIIEFINLMKILIFLIRREDPKTFTKNVYKLFGLVGVTAYFILLT